MAEQPETRSRLVVQGFLINAKSVGGVEARLAVRQVEDEHDPLQFCALADDDLVAALHDFTGHRVRVTISVLD